MKKDYFIQFTCGYGWLAYAECLEDAIVLAKANAIYKGYSRPRLKSVRFPNGENVMYGHSLVHPTEIIPDGISAD